MKTIIDFIMICYLLFAGMFMVLMVADQNALGMIALSIPCAIYYVVDTIIEKKKAKKSN